MYWICVLFFVNFDNGSVWNFHLHDIPYRLRSVFPKCESNHVWCFDSQFHFHLSFEFWFDYWFLGWYFFTSSPWFASLVKKASPWVVVRHANSMVPHDKFSIPDGLLSGGWCLSFQSCFSAGCKKETSWQLRVLFCTENDFWWDAFLHTLCF